MKKFIVSVIVLMVIVGVVAGIVWFYPIWRTYQSLGKVEYKAQIATTTQSDEGAVSKFFEERLKIYKASSAFQTESKEAHQALDAQLDKEARQRMSLAISRKAIELFPDSATTTRK